MTGFPPALRFGGGWESKEGETFLHPGAAGCLLCKAPWGAVPTHEQLQNPESEAGTPPVQGETAPPPTSAPPTLQPILKSPSSPPRGRQKRLREHPLPLHRGEPGAANVQAEHTRAGSSARGCAHRPLRRGADHARTVLPTPPPRAGRKSGGRRGRRSAEGAERGVQLQAITTPGWLRPPGGHGPL